MNIETAGYIQLAYAYSRLGLKDTAHKFFEHAIEETTSSILSSPNNAPYYYQRATLKYEIHNYEGVVSDLGQAIRIAPQHIVYYDLRGLAKFRLNKYLDAAHDFREATRFPSSVYQQALLHLQLTEEWIQTSVP